MSMIQSTKLSSRNQTVIPAFVRKALQLQSGDRIYWNIAFRDRKPVVIAEPKPKQWAKNSRGLGKHLWETVDIGEYIYRLREEWSNQT